MGLTCEDCKAHLMGAWSDPVMQGSPLDHRMIYAKDYSWSRPCPTGKARDLQIRTDIFGGECAQDTRRTRNREKVVCTIVTRPNGQQWTILHPQLSSPL